MTVTKADIVNLVADSTGLTKSDVEAVLSGFLYNIIDAIQNGDRVEIRGFGSFFAKEREERLVKNPRTNKVVSVDHRFVPVFRPAKYFKKSVNQNMLDKQQKEEHDQAL